MADILLLGRSGLGRTTLKEKLESAVDLISGEASNETFKFRVFEAPGFSGSATAQQEIPTVIDWIAKAQDEYQLKVGCILYFLPRRGPLEKADGSIQEEFKLLSHYFGQEVFNYVVVIATNPSKKHYQLAGFDNEDCEQTMRVLHAALKSAVREDIACPPIVYIGLNDSPKETLKKIRATSVLEKGTVILKIKDASLLYPAEEDPTKDYVIVDHPPSWWDWLSSFIFTSSSNSSH